MYKNILVSVDLGKAEAETKAINTAVELARMTGANLHVLTVVPDFGFSLVGGFFPKDHEKQALERANVALHEFTKQHVPKEVRHRHIVAHGSIYREILHYGDVCKADLIVMSAATPGPEDYLLGPNAARVARHAKVSVYVVR
ncbi:universal stress protein [Chelativorans composti]|jgi:Universal stress protein UspA and related nucleotide-binding proteins|uniref:Universal stress protein n=1 Tax=Chelativorans composti TaxID=768533 RepID=A0ABW5DLN2_9HYPH